VTVLFYWQRIAEKLMDLGLLISDAEPLIRQYGVLVVTIVS